MRKIMGYVMAAYLALTNQRFSKVHRINDTIVYKLIDVVGANILADKIKNVSNEQVILI